jgi:glycolate oxidase iron-sulfur subunit
VDITEAIYHGRDLLRTRDPERRRLRAAARFALKRPGLGFKAARLIRPLLPFLQRRGLIPEGISLPEEPLREGGNILKPGESPRGRVAMFTGCSVNFLFPGLGASLINVLLGLGYEVVLPPGEVCCGAPLRALGLEKDAASLARKNMEVFGRLRAEAVLSLCPTCTLATKVHYPKLIGEGLLNVMDASQFLAGTIKDISPLAEGRKVFYHDPCHLAFGLGVRREPRDILHRLGMETREPREAGCCGFSLSLTHREVSEGLLTGRLHEAGEGEMIVTACPGCMLQLRRSNRKVAHIIQLVDEAMDKEQDGTPAGRQEDLVRG